MPSRVGTSHRHADSAESELLRSVARVTLATTDIERASAALRRGIAWPRFIPLAHHHGVLPLLHRHLTAGALDPRLVPDAARASLRQEAERTARRSLLLSGELAVLLRDLDAAGIQAVCLKGPTLAQQLYGNVALRRFSDLDLIVAEADIERATAIISHCGYSAAPEALAMSDARRRDAHHDVTLFSQSRTHRVELHYYLLQPYGRRRYTMDSIAGEIERVSFQAGSAYVLTPELLLVYLTVHGTQHAWGRLEWVTAVAELLRSGRVVDWDAVDGFAVRLDAGRVLRAGLRIARDLLDAPEPPREASRQFSNDAAAQSAARAIVTRLRRTPYRRPSRLAVLAHQVRTDATMRDRASRLWVVLAVPGEADVASIRLPHVMRPLYYLLRPPRLLVRWMRGAGRPRPVSDERSLIAPPAGVGPMPSRSVEER